MSWQLRLAEKKLEVRNTRYEVVGGEKRQRLPALDRAGWIPAFFGGETEGLKKEGSGQKLK